MITLTYLDDLSRVRVELSGLPDGFAHVERSTNGLIWTTVRGATQLPITSGSGQIDDYEFEDGVENTYRVTVTPTSDPPAFAGSGPTAVNLDSTQPVTAALPAGVTTGQSIFVFASVEVGELQTPAGYSAVFSGNRIAVYAKTATASETDPVITANGGSANGGIAAQAVVFTNITTTLDKIALLPSTNTPQSIPTPSLQAPPVSSVVFQLGWRSAASGAVPNVPPGSTRIGSGNTGTSVQVWAYRIMNLSLPVPASEFSNLSPLIGGNAFGVTMSLEPVGIVVEESTITPSLEGRVWLKSIAYPMLNRPVDVLNWGPISRPSRTEVHSVAGRSLPIGVSDRHDSQNFELEVISTGWQDPANDPDALTWQRDLDLILSVSGIMFVHVPMGQPVPGGYVATGDLTLDRLAPTGQNETGDVPWTISIPCTVVAPPSPLIAGTTLTWGTVWNVYADWTQLINTNPTWRDVLNGVGDPNDLVAL